MLDKSTFEKQPLTSISFEYWKSHSSKDTRILRCTILSRNSYPQNKGTHFYRQNEKRQILAILASSRVSTLWLQRVNMAVGYTGKDTLEAQKELPIRAIDCCFIFMKGLKIIADIHHRLENSILCLPVECLETENFRVYFVRKCFCIYFRLVECQISRCSSVSVVVGAI